MTRRFALMIAVCILLLITVAPSCMAAPQVGVRMLSMAGAGVALADDGTAPFVNPAGISLVESTLTFEASGDPNLLPFLPALLRITAGNPSSEDYKTLITGGFSRPTAGLLASYNNRWYGVSLLAYGESNNEDFSGALAVMLTGAYQFEGALGAQFLSVGANAHLFKGVMASGRYDTQTQLMATDVTTVGGCAVDAALLLKVNDRMRIGVVGRNLWYAYEGKRTYRVTDMSNDSIIAESVLPCRFDWYDSVDMVPDDDQLLFVNDPSDYLVEPERITFDFGTAFKPFRSENITLALDFRGVRFVYDGLWSAVRFSAVCLGYEQIFGPLTLRLGMAVQNAGDAGMADFGGGLAYRTDAFTFNVGANWGEIRQLSIQAGFAWRL